MLLPVFGGSMDILSLILILSIILAFTFLFSSLIVFAYKKGLSDESILKEGGTLEKTKYNQEKSDASLEKQLNELFTDRGNLGGD